MVNVNKTKESIQNVLIFITDAIALIMSYYMSGFIWLMEIRNNTFSYVMKVLNGNIVTIIIAVLIAALFCNIKGDVLNRGKFEELASVMYHLVENLRRIAILIRPYMNHTSEKILNQLSISIKLQTWDSLKDYDKIRNITVTQKPEVLFARLDPQVELEAIKEMMKV